MAIELKEILNVDAQEGIDNIRQLREEIKEIKAAFETAEIGSKQYIALQEELYKQQYRLNELMRATKKPIQDVEGSFNSLNTELRRLKEAWKATGSEVDRAALGEKINAVKAQINAMNESIGNYQHNVGNYTNSILDAFNKMGGAIGAAEGPLKTFGVDIHNTSQAIKITQVVIQTFNTQTITAFISGMRGAVTAVESFVLSLSTIEGAIAATGIGLLVIALVELYNNFEMVSDLLQGITAQGREQEKLTGYISKGINEINKATSYEIQLAEAEGKTQEEIFEIREKAIEQAKRYADVHYQLADIAFQTAKLWGDEALALERLKKAEEEIAKADEQLNDLEREKKIYEARKKRQEQEKAAAEAKSKADRAAAEAARKRQEEERKQQAMFDAAEKEAQALIDEELKKLNQAIDIRQKAVEAQKSALQKEREEFEKNKALLEEWGISTEELEQNHQKKLTEIRQRAAEERRTALQAEADFEEEIRKIRAARDADAYGENPGLEDQIALWDEELEAERAYIERKIELNEELMASYEEGDARRTALMRENAKLHEELTNKEIENEQKKSKASDKVLEARKAAQKSTLASTTNFLKSVSQALGENTKAAKGFAAAQATIDAIGAAVAGFKAGYNQWKDAGAMAWMAPVQGAINAAAALAAGYAQVQKIMSVDPSGSNAGGSTATALAVPNIEGLNTPVDYTRQVTTETEREEMNRDNRVYILEEDIQTSNNRVRVRENETTF